MPPNWSVKRTRWATSSPTRRMPSFSASSRRAGKLPKDVVQASPAHRPVGPRRAPRHAARRRGFDLVGEVTQTCTIKRGNEFFEVNGGCTVIVDPDGDVRYAIYKRFDSKNRRDRQHAAMTGPLKQYWVKEKRRWTRPAMLQRLHAGRELTRPVTPSSPAACSTYGRMPPLRE